MLRKNHAPAYLSQGKTFEQQEKLVISSQHRTLADGFVADDLRTETICMIFHSGGIDRFEAALGLQSSQAVLFAIPWLAHIALLYPSSASLQRLKEA